MRAFRFLCGLSAVILFARPAVAETRTLSDIPVMHLNSSMGLSHNIVNDVYRDELGFLWIGTEDGLDRFDGSNVEVFYPEDKEGSIPTNSISRISGDRNGHLFVKGRDNLSVMDLRTEQFNLVSSDGVVGFTYYKGLFWADRFKVYSEDGSVYFSLNSQDGNSIVDISSDGQGRLYVALDNGVVLRVEEGNSVTSYEFGNIYCLDSGGDGIVWVNSRTEGTMAIFPDGSSKSFKTGSPSSGILDENKIRCVERLSDSLVYVASYAGLSILNIWTSERWDCNYESGLHGFDNKAVRTVCYEDGMLFLGTYHAGLHYCQPFDNTYKEFSPLETGLRHLSSPIVSSIAEDDSGVLWIGTVGGGLNIYDASSLLPHRLKSALCSDKRLENIKYIYFDPIRNAMWICMFSEGICRVDITDGRVSWISPAFADARTGQVHYAENITRMVPYGKDYLLATSVNGILMIDCKKMTISHFLGTTMGNTPCFDLECQSDSCLWVTDRHKLTRIDLLNPGKFKSWSFGQVDGMSEEYFVIRIFKSSDDTIWLGTNGSGLFRYDSKTDSFARYDTSSGLPNNYINDIYQASDSGILYLATNNGVCKFDPVTLSCDIYNMTTGYGLTISTGVFESADSTLYVIGDRSVLAIAPESSGVAHDGCNLYIKSVSVRDCVLHPSKSGPLYKSPLFQHSLTLHGDISSLSFYIANSGLNPLMNRAFEYCLFGLERDYHQATGPVIQYTNLKAGKYTLKVKGTIPDKNGMFPEVEMALTIRPPFLKSTFFLLLCLSIATVVAIVLIRSIINGTRLKSMLDMEQHDKEQQKMLAAAKTTFMTNISHEFKTPIALIGGNLEEMMTYDLSPEANKAVGAAYRNTVLLGKLVDEFISLNRTESPDYKLNLIPCDINSFVREQYDLFSDYARGKGIDYRLSVCSGECKAEIDVDQMASVLSNLYSNAFKYTRDKIVTEVRKSGDSVLISVSDNGRGIRPENTSRVFERFWQEDESNVTMPLKGSGIGLSFVKNIVDLHGGGIQVESEPGVRTCFTITLKSTSLDPVHVEMLPPQLETMYINEEKEKTVQESEKGGPLLLIVEDNPEMRTLLARIFQSYSVIVASNGKEGFALAEARQPDIVISDIVMPEMSGIQMCRQMKSSQSTCHIPVILLTALSTDDQIRHGLETGADDYVTKPFSSSMLQSRVKNILRNRRLLQEKYQNDIGVLGGKGIAGNPIDDDFMTKVIAVVDANMQESEFDVTRLCREVGMSRTLLFNKLKALTGLSPNKFILSVKIRKAASALLSSEKESVADIAYRCGFNTPSYFIKCFKNQFGKTPYVYRKINAQGKSARSD